MDATPRPRSALNRDILLNIMSVSDKRTVSRMMRTSRELYAGGPQFLLQDAVALEHGKSILSFVDFMRAEHPQRFRYLAILEISTGSLSKEAARMLEKFIVECETHLKIRKLTIRHAEDFFMSGSGLSGAFALLEHVKHMEVTGIGPRTNLFLLSMKSHLETAKLVMIPFSFDNGEKSDGGHRNPILQLRNSQSTLRSLIGHFCDCDSDSEEPYKEYDEVYPDLTELALYANEIPDTANYARAFPNVQTVKLKCDSRWFRRFGVKIDEFSTLRELNKQQTLEEGGSWGALRSVHGTLTDHYVLGLMCPVEEMHVHTTGADMNGPMLRSVLADTSPSYLELQGLDVGLFFHDKFTQLMRGDVTNSVHRFKLTISFVDMLEPGYVDVAKALDELIAGLSEMSSLRSFMLTFSCAGLKPDSNEIQSRRRLNLPLPDIYPAEEYLRDLDLRALARRICDAVLSLKTVTVSLIEHRARENASATVGEDVEYGEGAVEQIPLAHAS